MQNAKMSLQHSELKLASCLYFPNAEHCQVHSSRQPSWRGGKCKPEVSCRSSLCTRAGTAELPFLERLSKEQAPAIFALGREHEPFRVMRQVQKQILTDIAQKLSIHAAPTTVKEDGLAYFTSTDKQTSVALQVDLGHLGLADC